MPRFAELPDGTRLEFPDDTPDDVIDAAVKRELGVSSEPQPISQFNDPRGAALTIGSSAIAEPLSGLAGILGFGTGLIGGLVPGGETPLNKATRFGTASVEGTRDFITIDPINDASARAVESIGNVAEGATKAVRSPIAGLAGLGSLAINQDINKASETTRSVINEGIGPTAAEALDEAGAPPSVSALTKAIPTGIASVLGVRGVSRVNPRVAQVSDELSVNLQRRGIDPSDASPENIQRIQQAITELDDAQRARVETLRDVGIDEPTRAQVTRSADDFQLQQETAKRSGPVRDRLETQEGQIAQTFDRAIEGTEGRPVTSGSSVVDEVVGRSTSLDDQISALYRKARQQADGEVSLDNFAKRVIDNLDSDGASDGLFSAVRGELRRRGVIDNDGNVIGKVDVATAEEIRKFVNSQFDARNKTFANTQIRQLKETLDNDVFRAAGEDIFREARAAKRSFEEGLSNARISRFDKQNRSLVRDILENKIDPDSLVQRITSSKSYRAEDLRQLRDYLSQTDSGIAAFDDLRAQVLQNIRDKAFIGPEDAQGVRALSRAALERELKSIGQSRLDVLFTIEERGLLNKLLAATRIREPVRGTALGKGPSAQAVEALNKQITDFPLLGRLFEGLKLNRDGRVVLSGQVRPESVVVSAPAEAALVPLAIGSE